MIALQPPRIRKLMATGLDFSYEAQFGHPVIGVDEVGRGPLAGPVVAAAVVLDPARLPAGLRDSKKVPKAQHGPLAEAIRADHIWALGRAEVEEIDRINILQAAMAAMARAVAGVLAHWPQDRPAPRLALIDGNRVPDGLAIPARTIIKGDGKVASIAAASLLAKAVRDQEMTELARKHPHFGWENNAGYGTAAHMTGLKTHGVTPHHRRSFKPIHKILCEDSPLSP